jgi:hypothetical protein
MAVLATSFSKALIRGSGVLSQIMKVIGRQAMTIGIFGTEVQPCPHIEDFRQAFYLFSFPILLRALDVLDLKMDFDATRCGR